MSDSLSETKRMADAFAKELYEIEQTLGKVLGFPWRYKNQDVFPGATEEDGIETGHLQPVDIAYLAAKEITNLRQEVAALKARVNQ